MVPFTFDLIKYFLIQFGKNIFLFTKLWVPILNASSTDKLNISDFESKTLHHDSAMILNFFLILNSGLLNLTDF